MIPELQHLYLQDHLNRIRSMVTSHVNADVVLVASREKLGNRIALSQWRTPGRKDRILLARTIGVGEQISIVQDLREALGRAQQVRDFLNGAPPDSFQILSLVVLHEVAHIKYRWDASLDKECTLWALEQICEPGFGGISSA